MERDKPIKMNELSRTPCFFTLYVRRADKTRRRDASALFAWNQKSIHFYKSLRVIYFDILKSPISHERRIAKIMAIENQSGSF